MCLIVYAIDYNTYKKTILAFDNNHILHKLVRKFVSATLLPSNCLIFSHKVLCRPRHERDLSDKFYLLCLLSIDFVSKVRMTKRNMVVKFLG